MTENTQNISSVKDNFPIKVYFSLKPIIDKVWQNLADSSNPYYSDLAKKILDGIKDAPELMEPIYNNEVLEKHRDLVEAIFSAVVSHAGKEFDYYAAVPPFNIDNVFFETKSFKRLKLFEDDNFYKSLNRSSKWFIEGRIIYSSIIILSKFYGINYNFEYPVIYNYKDEQTGLERYARIRMFPWFSDIKSLGPLKPLPEEILNKVKSDMWNVELWSELIDMKNFEFYGFLLFNAVDITNEEILSSLKNDLIEKGALVSEKKFSVIQHKLRSLLKQPDIMFGIVPLTGKNDVKFEHSFKIGNSFLLDEKCMGKCCGITGSVYEKVLTKPEITVIDDLDNYACGSVEKGLKELGVKNIALAPLIYEDETIAIMEFASPNPGDINELNAVKLTDILPLFALCVKRSLEEMDTKVQAVINEKFTAIHPSVEWRFRKAAINYLRTEEKDEFPEMEEIVFKDVYPLYSLSDIRNSSNLRNAAIQSDLKDNLLLAKEVITSARLYKKMPVLDQINFRIDNRITALGAGLHSGDEAEIISFLKKEMEPLFGKIRAYGGKVNDAITKYKESIDKDLGFVYNKRKDYEASVAKLNEKIAAFVDDEQDGAQEIFPHYFERYKTDGVEFTMYIGGSISENDEFNKIYLKNLRLWQFLLMCKIAYKAEQIKPDLEVPLDIAHLILVQDLPLSIRFHLDQKKFDVDGTYNVHYEIMKKRIDKAEIRGKEERLTQPGKIAIVYTQNSESAEYKQYIEYLQSKGYLEKEVEELELENLQGVYGLKALRVAVNTKSDILKGGLFKDDINRAVKEFSEA